jgi:hypothetical protein
MQSTYYKTGTLVLPGCCNTGRTNNRYWPIWRFYELIRNWHRVSCRLWTNMGTALLQYCDIALTLFYLYVMYRSWIDVTTTKKAWKLNDASKTAHSNVYHWTAVWISNTLECSNKQYWGGSYATGNFREYLSLYTRVGHIQTLCKNQTATYSVTLGFQNM